MLSDEEIWLKVKDFPTLPTIYTKLVEVISNPRTTVQDVADLIIKDQSSTTKILKIVNSPIMGIQKTVNNITQAIFFLGFNEVKNIVLTLSVMEMFAGTNSIKAFNIIDLWKHSIAVATIAKLLATNLKIRNTEDYFVGGIVHDIGILFFIRNFNMEYNRIFEKAVENNVSITTLEREVFGITHYSIGDMIAKKWKLPVQLQNVIKHQRNGTIEGRGDTLVSCIHLANTISQIMNLDYYQDRDIDIPNFAIWNNIHFEPGVISNLYQPIMDIYNQSVSILRLK
jgi:HD-like signal output (HDOD) protein